MHSDTLQTTHCGAGEMSHPREMKLLRSFVLFCFCFVSLRSCASPPALLFLQLLLLVPLGGADASHLLSATTEEWHGLINVTLRYVCCFALLSPPSRPVQNQPSHSLAAPLVHCCWAAFSPLLLCVCALQPCARVRVLLPDGRITCLLCSAAPLVARAAVPSDSSHCFRRPLCSQPSFLDISTRSHLMKLASASAPIGRGVWR
jgi:hypothetical protein